VIGNDCSQIVRSWPAEGTCESYYQTADGRVWKTDLSPHSADSSTTGVARGYLHTKP
jgi:hypothetical protein